MTYNYNTTGVCSKLISIDMDENNIITNVVFTGGCNGNLSGISRLVKGKTAQEVIELLKDTKCGNKITSCPDQLANALEKMTK